MQIDGYFNMRDEPVIGLDLGPSVIEVLADTGFNGSLIIPTPLAYGLDLPLEDGVWRILFSDGRNVFGVFLFHGNWLARTKELGVRRDLLRSQRGYPWKSNAQELLPHDRLWSSHSDHRRELREALLLRSDGLEPFLIHPR